MEPAKLLASGLTLEESKAKRQEKQAARYRHRLGTYVPSGDSKRLLEALMATSPRKSPTPRKHIASGSTKRRKSVKPSTKGKNGGETTDESTQEKQTKVTKSTGRKSIRVADSAERGEKRVPRRSMSEAGANTAEDEAEDGHKPSTSRQTNKATRTANSKSTKSSKKSATTKKPKPSKYSSRNTGAEDDSDDRPVTPEPVQRKVKKSSTKPPPTQTDNESDDLAIKKPRAPKKVDKGKARAMQPPPETFESAETDVDPEDSRPGQSNMKPLSVEEKSLRDAPPDVYETITTPIISRVISNRGDVSEEERKPPPKKRGRSRKDKVEEQPPPKRGKTQEADDGEVKGSTKSKPKRQAKKLPPKPRSMVAKGRTRKNVEPLPDTSDEEKEEFATPETTASGSNTQKRQRRKRDKRDERDGEPSSNPNRVRLDSIPPEGIIIRKENGIVERLLPPVIQPKRKASVNRGKTRNFRRRAIPAHVLKYIGPTRIGSPLKGEGTDTDDDLNIR